MAKDGKEYLAATVLNDGGIVNYRMLSRALKIHCNAAKEYVTGQSTVENEIRESLISNSILSEFHRTQNARKQDSVHATYLLTGTRQPTVASQSNGVSSHGASDSLMSDGLMSSSMPEPEPVQMEHIPVTSVTLVAQEHLEDVKKLYDTITSQHIYSLEPGPLSNIQILSDCNRKVASETSQEDPLERWKIYGTIHNPKAKRRTARRPPPSQAAAMTAGMKPATGGAAASGLGPTKPKSNLMTTTSSTSETNRPTSRDGSKSTDAKKPATMKRESSNLFKSFAKTKPPTAAVASKKDNEEDIIMKEDSEGEDSTSEIKDEVSDEQKAANAEKAKIAKREREEREAAIRKMMEDEGDGEGKEDDDEEVDGGSEANAESEKNAELEEDEEGDTPMAEEAEPVEQVATTTIQDGRRRGRRRVMKKKTKRDAHGYIVTTEEPEWESFSEDEGVAGAGGVKSDLTRKAPVSYTSSGAKAPPAKKGQGNIMNFFGKKS